MRTIQAKKSHTRKILNPKIEDLRAGMKKIHLKAKVLEIPEPNIVYTRLGSSASVSNILVSDETGTIRMSLWNRQINSISKGDIIELENGKVASYRGQLQLRIGRKGSLNVIKCS
jgi:replication factor A1